MRHALNGLLLAASLAAVAAGLWQRDRLPAPGRIVEATLAAPEQVRADEAPFRVVAGGVTYTVSPLYRYELRGLVVSRHDTSAWWDVVHRDWWRDHLNVADLCVAWGGNLERGVYRELRYASDTFTCHVAAPSQAVWRRFEPTELSNNHLLAADPATARRLRAMRRGDQVLIRGWLAEYAHDDGGRPFRRGTSTRRDDTGNGACETIWVTEARVLRTANRGWRTLLDLAWLGVAASVALWFVLPAPPVE
jgi:hypothetical protein